MIPVPQTIPLSPLTAPISESPICLCRFAIFFRLNTFGLSPFPGGIYFFQVFDFLFKIRSDLVLLSSQELFSAHLFFSFYPGARTFPPSSEVWTAQADQLPEFSFAKVILPASPPFDPSRDARSLFTSPRAARQSLPLRLMTFQC